MAMEKMIQRNNWHQIRQGNGFLELNGVRFYPDEKNEVELLTPDGWKDVLLELDDELGWIATTEAHSEKNGFYIEILDLRLAGLFARIPQ